MNWEEAKTLSFSQMEILESMKDRDFRLRRAKAKKSELLEKISRPLIILIGSSSGLLVTAEIDGELVDK